MSVKGYAILLMAIVVSGVLFAGCTRPEGIGPVTTTVPLPSPSSAGVVTAVPASREDVNATLPVPTLQTPDTLTPASNESGLNESAVMDKNGIPSSSVENQTGGGLFINIQRGGSVDGVKVFIAREGTDLSQIEYTYLPDRTLVEGENKGYIQVKIPPDGRSDLIRLPPGNYTAYLPDWNSGAPEQQSFTIREEVTITIHFMGFSAAGGGGCGC
jgi:hypothetical protein